MTESPSTECQRGHDLLPRLNASGRRYIVFRDTRENPHEIGEELEAALARLAEAIGREVADRIFDERLRPAEQTSTQPARTRKTRGRSLPTSTKSKPSKTRSPTS